MSDNVWWLVVQNTRQFLAAYEDPQRGQLRELPLPKCVEIWGWAPFGDEDLSPEAEEKRNNSFVQGNISNYLLPVVAPKYLKWLRSRRHICREMSSMMQLGEHPNIVKLHEVLELVQVSTLVVSLNQYKYYHPPSASSQAPTCAIPRPRANASRRPRVRLRRCLTAEDARLILVMINDLDSQFLINYSCSS